MSYQVLARKWRPKTFRETVGQEHVLKALINALDHNRLHHAYLFTGTRGVGKTSIARILAKCLNCDVGVSSEPCGQCSSCISISEGRFVDLIEVDAASSTKVEDTRILLENVQYAPTVGRYKVYLIDEVHMLSTHSFNALLKTLEEPPPHVKFLLATTDPQKLPATILSRCLQFNLKNMTPERIVGHLQYVLEQEMVTFEEAGLWLLGRAADGSMRDAMSLTDQAISFGSGKLLEADVRSMLGTIDQRAVYEIIHALTAADGAKVLAAVQSLSEHAPDYMSALEEILTLLHRIAIAQAVPDAADNSFGDREQIIQLAAQISAEDIQLYYQLGLNGRRDLPLAPDPRSGFEMVLLRMLAFKPAGVAELPQAVVANSAMAASAQESSAVTQQPAVSCEEPQPTKKPDPAIASASAVGDGRVKPIEVVAPQVSVSDSAVPWHVDDKPAALEASDVSVKPRSEAKPVSSSASAPMAAAEQPELIEPAPAP
ncbi:MAG: DNA polymerase III subunit gamma/tau, partial [Spongiibacteraceae bacterium]